jgi:hypothetical protein
VTVRVIAQPGLPAILMIVRPTREDREVLIVVNPTEPVALIRQLGRVLCDREERSQLGRFLADA